MNPTWRMNWARQVSAAGREMYTALGVPSLKNLYVLSLMQIKRKFLCDIATFVNTTNEKKKLKATTAKPK
jgi:hypothetical protein